MGKWKVNMESGIADAGSDDKKKSHTEWVGV